MISRVRLAQQQQQKRRPVHLLQLIGAVSSGVIIAAIPAVVILGALFGSGTAGAEEPDSKRRAANEAAARSTWAQMVTVRVESPAAQELTEQAVDRFFATEGGRWLIGELGRIHIDPVLRQIGLKITVLVVESLPPGADEDIGYYTPRQAGVDSYEVFVRLPAAAEADTGTETIDLFGIYPDNSACDIIFWYQEPASTMAHTLFHELLHIWFIHTYRFEQRKYPTGHDNARWCQFEEEFLQLLRAHAGDLEKVEGVTPPGALRVTPKPATPVATAPPGTAATLTLTPTLTPTPVQQPEGS